MCKFKYIYLASTFPKIDKQHEIQFMRQEVLCRTVAVLFGRSYPVRKQEKLKTKPAIELSLWTRKFTIGHSDIKTTANIYGHLDISGKAIVLKTMKKVTTKK